MRWLLLACSSVMSVGCGSAPRVEYAGMLGTISGLAHPVSIQEDLGEPLEMEDLNVSGDPELEITGFWVPSLKVKADEDENEIGMGVEFDADLNYGDGWGARAAAVNQKRQGLGLVYITTQHTERDTRRGARTHQAYLELYQGVELKSKWLSPTFGMGIGVGGAVFDFREQFDDTGGAAGMIRGEVGVTVAQRLDIVFGGAAFLWGYPGETIGYGGFLTFGGNLRF